MKHIFIYLVMSLMLITTLTAQAPDTLWTKTFGESFATDEAFSVQQTTDGGYIVYGYERSYGNGDADFYLIKTDAYGNKEWENSYGGANTEHGKSVQQTLDGGYVLCGYKLGGNPYSVIHLLKVNETGDSVWAKTFGGSDVDRGYSAQQTTDGGYIICGTMRSGSGQPAKFCLIKTDANGNEVWTKTSGPAWGVGYAVQQTSDGGFIACGYGNDDIYLIKTTAAGDSIWARTFGDFGYDAGYSVQQTVDGGYIICGEDNVAGNTQVSLIKTDNNGNLIWSKNFGGTSNDIGYSVTQTADGGYIISGTTGSFGAGNLDVYIIKTDATGDSLWTKTQGTIYEERGYSIQQTSDGGYIIAGTKNYDIWLIKLEGAQSFLSPAAFDKWIAGETDTIKWTETGWVTQNIKCILNFGTPLVQTITIEEGILLDSAYYEWDVPDTLLSYQTKIVIENAANPTEKIESEIFRIKPYVLTRVEEDSTYYAYKKSRDQWGFSNTQADMWPPSWFIQFDYRGEDPFTGSQYSQWQGDSTFYKTIFSKHPDWVSFVNTFTTDACYFSTLLNIYKYAAVIKWRSIGGNWGGSCFGIAAANALAFSHREQFQNKYPNYPAFINPITVVSATGVKRVVNELYTHQYGNPTQANDPAALAKTPNQTLNEIRQMLLEDNAQVKTLSIYNNGGNGGHTILAYGLKQDPVQKNLYYVQIYDNSNPNSNNPITINTLANGGNGSWSTPDWAGWGGNGKIHLEIPSIQYLNGASLPTRSIPQSVFILPQNVLEINYQSDSEIKIIDTQGNITGYVNNLVLNQIPGSWPQTTKNGSETPPYGYSLQTDNYSIVLSDFVGDTVSTFFFTGNKSFMCERNGATQTQTDRLFFDGGVSVSNPDAQTKSVKLLNIINETTQEKLTVVRSLELAQNDSVKIENPDSNKVKLISSGTAKNYDIELNYVTENGLGRFGDFNIQLTANTSHTFVPVWADLTNTQLIVLVDVGNDGTIDDTLHLNNTVGVEDEGSLLSPNSYNLAQNYPNPFNPVTTIQYSIPQRSSVTLKIYDVLGNEVATLVNEEKGTGVYTINFNASQLTSGIYFYRLQAGSFNQVKKMILIK